MSKGGFAAVARPLCARAGVPMGAVIVSEAHEINDKQVGHSVSVVGER